MTVFTGYNNMAIIEVEGLGKVEIAGDTPTQEEQQAIVNALNSKIQPSQPQQRQAGFVERTAEALGKRGGNISQTLGAQGFSFLGQEQTLPETALQLYGQGLGAVGDVLGNTMISGYRYLPEVPFGVEEAGSALANLPVGESTLGDTVLGGLGNIVQKYDNFAQENPRTARNLGALGNIAAFHLPTKFTSKAPAPIAKTTQLIDDTLLAAPKTIQKTAGAVKSLSENIKNLIPAPEKITAKKLAAQASQAYKIADELGGTVSPNLTVKIQSEISKKINQIGSTLPLKTQKALQKVSDPENVVRKAQEIFDTLSGKPLSLEGFQAIDKTLGDMAFNSNISDAAARKVMIMQRTLRDAIDNVSPDDLINKEGFDVYKRATAIWHKQSKIRDLENITKRAFATDRPADNLRRALRRFTANDKNIKHFSDLEIKAIEQAADAGTAKEIMRALGGRLIPQVAFGAGSPDLAAGMSLLGAQARGLADEGILREMDDIARLIAAGKEMPKQSALATIGNKALDITSSGSGAAQSLYGGGLGRLSTLGALGQIETKQ